MTRVHFSKRAVTEFWVESDWWQEHRLKNPSLFDDEVKAATEVLETAPLSGLNYAVPDVPDVRRIVLASTRYHLYYHYDGASDMVTVLSIWSAQRRRGPRLARPHPPSNV